MSTVDLSKVETLTKFFTYFQNNLNHPVAVKPKEYLKSRNINYELLEIGYNSGQFHHRGKLDEADTKACVDAGLLIPYKGSIPKATGATYTAFAKDCIIFPLKNQQNQIVSIYGRRITDETENKHYYLKNRTGLYPGYPKQETTRLILTEAIIDTATLLQIQEITAEYELLSCYGTNGLTEEHKQAIKELQKLEEIIFFFDGDKAGNEAIQKYFKELSELLPNVKLTAVETPENEDVNSLSIAYDTEPAESGSRTPLKNRHKGEQIFTHLLENRKDLFLLPEETEIKQEQGNITEVPPEPPRTQTKLNTKNRPEGAHEHH